MGAVSLTTTHKILTNRGYIRLNGSLKELKVYAANGIKRDRYFKKITGKFVVTNLFAYTEDTYPGNRTIKRLMPIVSPSYSSDQVIYSLLVYLHPRFKKKIYKTETLLAGNKEFIIVSITTHLKIFKYACNTYGVPYEYKKKVMSIILQIAGERKPIDVFTLPYDILQTIFGDFIEREVEELYVCRSNYAYQFHVPTEYCYTQSLYDEFNLKVLPDGNENTFN